MSDLKPKPMRASRISIAQLMQPENANNLGNVHGGWIMKLVDEAGALACMRHAQRRVVTVTIDSMTFQLPIRTSDLVILDAASMAEVAVLELPLAVPHGLHGSWAPA